MADIDREVEEVEALLNELLPFAHKMLREHREFLPFGGRVEMDGNIVWEGASDGDDHPHSQDLIDILNNAHTQLATEGKLRARALLYDIRTVPPGREELQDAIRADVDHASGYSASYVFPYEISASGDVAVENAYCIPGRGVLFPRAST